MSAESLNANGLHEASESEEVSEGRKGEVRRISVSRVVGSMLAAGAIIGSAMMPNSRNEEIISDEYVTVANPTCYGDYCTGKYADETNCDEDAHTIAEAIITRPGTSGSLEVHGVEVGAGDSDPDEVGRLELRASDECGTVWGRLNTKAGSRADVWGIQSVGAQQDGGYVQKRDIAGVLVGSPPAVSFSPQIYGRDREYRAFVEIQSLGIVTTNGTYWVEGPEE